jgi:hypothetical protein
VKRDKPSDKPNIDPDLPFEDRLVLALFFRISSEAKRKPITERTRANKALAAAIRASKR